MLELIVFFATPRRNTIIDINDFDETLLVPWEWDLKRLAVSVIVNYAAMQELEVCPNSRAWPGIAEHDYPKLVQQDATPRVNDSPSLIFHSTAEEGPSIKTGYTEGIELYREALPEHVLVLFDKFCLCDLVVKSVCVGSVGTVCAVALILAAEDGPLLLQGSRKRGRPSCSRMRERACIKSTASQSLEGKI